MATKIKNISISGIRGIKNTITLPLSEKSILLYGDNGTGKSSISDAIEWFYSDKVAHLAGSEIDLKEALRNSFLNDTNTSAIAIDFSRSNLNTTKELQYKKNKFVVELSNSSEEFSKY
jgi:recombinational DNA repair ATPase RecF